MTNLKSNPKSHFIPDEDESTPARRRHARRVLTLLEGDDRERWIDELAYRTTPSIDFYIFSVFSAIVFSLGLFFNSPVLLVLGAVIAPIMTPVVGIALGIITGSNRFFRNSLSGLLVGCIIVFSISLLAGFINASFPPVTLDQAHIAARFSWEALLALTCGAIGITWSVAQDRGFSVLSSVLISYSLYLPVSVAGFGLGGRIPHLFPDGLIVFAVHLALGCLIAVLTLAYLGYRPQTLFGYTVGGTIALLSIILIIGLSATGAAYVGRIALPTYTPTLTPSVTPTVTPSTTPLPPTLTPTSTFTPTLTPTITLTPTQTPTSILGLIKYPDGAKIRATPGYNQEIIEFIANGTILWVMDTPPIQIDQQAWIQVIDPNGKKGWIWQALIITATPPKP
jgi:hypothetical protein